MRKLLLKGILGFCLLAGLAVATGSWVMSRYLDQPLTLQHELNYELRRGGSLTAVAYDLDRQGVLSYPRMLLLYSRLSGRGASIQVGEYQLHPGVTVGQLLDKLEQGDVRRYSVTLVEGWTLHQVLEFLARQEKLKQVLHGSIDSLFEELGLTSQKGAAEGLFYPDTYLYHKGMSDRDLLLQAYDKMALVLEEQWQQRSSHLPYDSPYEALIMASLIERETGQADERPLIAGVFVRRLQKKMRLQTDPAVIYGLGSAFDGNLRSRHLKDASNPYNTYRHHGLPPTPIALAGREAIHAALHPASGNTLYFVAKGDGSHYFSPTLGEHQQAVRKYQIEQRRKDYSSAPK